jgi:siroheme synthase (precorrin-2 oxidase/ferrochelatase)
VEEADDLVFDGQEVYAVRWSRRGTREVAKGKAYSCGAENEEVHVYYPDLTEKEQQDIGRESSLTVGRTLEELGRRYRILVDGAFTAKTQQFVKECNELNEELKWIEEQITKLKKGKRRG